MYNYYSNIFLFINELILVYAKKPTESAIDGFHKNRASWSCINVATQFVWLPRLNNQASHSLYLFDFL